MMPKTAIVSFESAEDLQKQLRALNILEIHAIIPQDYSLKMNLSQKLVSVLVVYR